MRFLTLIILALLASAGCAPSAQDIPEPIVQTPLELDPTEQYELAQWWTNGDRMLRLDPVSSYALFGDMNRYHPPIERGRWSKQSYAFLHLEPYRELRTPPIRVQITKISGKLALVLPQQPPMFPLPAPPRAPEDDLLGRWTGDRASLDFFEDLFYDFNPTPATPDMLGHTGRWRLDDDIITLSPRTTAVAPLQLRVTRHPAGTITLTTPDLTLHRP